MRTRILCLAVCAATLLVAAAPAAATTECRYLTSCESRTSPWIAVPSERTVVSGEASQASYAFPCPLGRYAAGFDWTPDRVDDVFLDVPYDGWGGYAPVFVLRNDHRDPGTAQIDIGCVPEPAGSRAAIEEDGATLRMTERRVRAGRVLDLRQRCETGERAAESGGAVLFETKAPPSKRVLKGHVLALDSGARGVRGTVTTADFVGDDERVVLHLYAVCV
ncbi:MAG TPA: hypothetical protein VFR97_00785 [Capillimicrobium sp.]|nr:hypothetical protein [Capillimicrobium sp.]